MRESCKRVCGGKDNNAFFTSNDGHRIDFGSAAYGRTAALVSQEGTKNAVDFQ